MQTAEFDLKSHQLYIKVQTTSLFFMRDEGKKRPQLYLIINNLPQVTDTETIKKKTVSVDFISHQDFWSSIASESTGSYYSLTEKRDTTEAA